LDDLIESEGFWDDTWGPAAGVDVTGDNRIEVLTSHERDLKEPWKVYCFFGWASSSGQRTGYAPFLAEAGQGAFSSIPSNEREILNNTHTVRGC
jgi:hypothetical protein